MLGGGEEGALYRPLLPDGNYSDQAYGCHRGRFEWMNIQYAQPGRAYYLGVRDENGIRRAALRGWQVVPATDPERLGVRNDPNFKEAGLDGLQTGGETVLMFMPEERYAQLCAEREAANARMREDNATEFTESDNAMSLQERYRSRVYFQASGHGPQRL